MPRSDISALIYMIFSSLLLFQHCRYRKSGENSVDTLLKNLMFSSVFELRNRIKTKKEREKQMKKMKTIIALILALTFIVFTVAACGNGDDAAPAATPAPATNGDAQADPGDADPEDPADPVEAEDLEPIRIGVAFALTTPFAMGDAYNIDNVILAAAQINEAGGIMGRPVEVFVEDTQDNPTAAVNAVNRLVYEHNIDFLIGPSMTDQHRAIEPILAENQVLVLGLSTNVPLILDHEWFVRTRPNDAIAGTAAALFALDDLNATNIGIININTDFGNGARDIIVDVLASRGLEPVAIETYAPDDRDLSPMLLSMRDAGAEVIIHWGFTADSAIIKLQNAQLGINIPMVMSPPATIESAIEMAEGNSDGHYAIMDAFLEARQDELVLGWLETFEAMFGRPNINPGSASAFDAPFLLKAAIEAAGTTDPIAVRDAIRTIEMDGVAGTFSFPSPLLESRWSVDIIQFDGMDPTFVRTVHVEYN